MNERRKMRIEAILKQAPKRKRDEEDEGEEMKNIKPKNKLGQLSEEEIDMLAFDKNNRGALKYCNLLGTITLNKTPSSITAYVTKNHNSTIEQFKSWLEDALKSFVKDKNNWIPKVIMPNGRPMDLRIVGLSDSALETISGGAENRDGIVIDDNDIVWEVGDKFHRLHLHFVVRLSYFPVFRGYFHLDRERLFWAMRNDVRLTGFPWEEAKLPYINLRYIKNTLYSVKDYMQKLHHQEEFTLLAQRTLDRINEYHKVVADRESEAFQKYVEGGE